MHHDPRVEWIQANRTRKNPVQPVGAAVERVTAQLLQGRELQAAREAVMAIAAVVDEEFRRRCRVVVEERGTLVVNVDSPALVYPMRLRWTSVLRDVLARTRSASPIRRIVFEHGTAGMSVPGCPISLPQPGPVKGSGKKPMRDGSAS